MKRHLQALLCVLLVLALLAPPSAAAGSGLTLACRQQGDSGVSLALTGLGSSGGVYAVQLKLTITGTYRQAAFAPADGKNAYAPPCTVEQGQGKTAVTIYLDLGDSAHTGSRLELGVLTLDGAYTLPQGAAVTLLDRGLEPFVSGRSIPVAAESGPVTPGTAGEIPFTDVKKTDWFYNPVCYVYERGIMSGTGKTAFSPGGTVTRGMLVMILYNLEGKPSAGSSPFRDVSDQYYAKAVAWAARNGIVSGYGGGLFRPEDPITREQLALILMKYAAFKGYDTAARADLSSFRDASLTTYYAMEAMRWANAMGLINGTGDKALLPTGGATRDQAASILMNFCQRVK